MNGIILTPELETRVTQALKQLIATSTPRKSARSQQQDVLKKFAPIIVAARAKRRSWSAIAATLKDAGLIVSKETLRRTFEGGKKPRRIAPRKSVENQQINATEKAAENPQTIDAEFVRIDAPETQPEIVIDVAPDPAPEIEPEMPVMIIETAPPIIEPVVRRFGTAAMFGSGLE